MLQALPQSGMQSDSGVCLYACQLHNDGFRRG